MTLPPKLQGREANATPLAHKTSNIPLDY